MSEKTTALSDQCVVPWRLGFYLGIGVDCLTGATMHSAIEEFQTEVPTMFSTSNTMHLCIDMESTSRAFAAYESHASPAYNIAPLHGGVVDHVMKRGLYSPTTFSIVVRREIRSSPSPAPNVYRLTPPAAEALEHHGVSGFRELFGHYFVSEVQVGSSFEAIVTYVCATPDKRSALVKRLQPHTAFNVNWDYSSLHAVLQEGIPGSMSLDIRMEGVRPSMDHTFVVSGSQPRIATTTLELRIGELLEWFGQNILPTSVAAYLRSYTTVVGGLHKSPQLPVPSRIFLELEQLRHLLRGCSVLSGALLSFGSNETLQRLRERIRALQEDSTMLQPKLVFRDDLRQSLLREARDVGTEISRFNLADNMWRQCYSRGSTAERRAATQPGMIWHIGITDVQGDGEGEWKEEGEIESHWLVISVSKRPLSLPWRRALRSAELTGRGLSLFNVNDDRPQRIIGCRIVSRFGRGICQVSNNFLLSTWQPSLPIVVSSGFLRRDEWEIQVWTSRNPYLDALAQLA